MTQETSSLWVLRGSDEPLQQLHWLHAGPLQVALDGIDLRYVRAGDLELVRRVYVAVRDRDWNTIPADVSGLEVDDRADSFDVRFQARHTSDDIEFAWEGHITGDRDGRIQYRMEGQGERDMLYNRIGFCVLHPWRECAGRPFRGATPDGPIVGVLPALVAPQRFENGVYVPLFPSVSRLAIDVEDGNPVVFEFEGDLFETEDQRNWSDASFKTYCTPLARGFPHALAKGQALSQSVSVHAAGNLQTRPGHARRPIAIGAPTGSRIPPVGLGLGATALPDAEVSLLSTLAPAHVRTDVHLDEPAWRDSLAVSLAASARIQTDLELAVFVGPGSSAELSSLRDLIGGGRVARVLVLPEDAQTVTPEETTPAELVELVRTRVGLEEVPFAGGTDMYFCELNRTKPQIAAMDGVFWSINPQVHASDDLSLFETAEAQGEQVRTAAGFSGGKKIFVGPVTLRRRRNVNALTPEESEADSIPESVDPRQPSLLAAAWTLASAKHLCEQGVDAATYFETTGPRGVIPGDASPPESASRTGKVFPVYHVLADLCSLRGGNVLNVHNVDPLELALLAIRHETSTTMLVANTSAQPRRADFLGLDATARARRLNTSTASQASLDPDAFRRDTAPVALADGLELEPYETLRLDF